MDLSSHPSLLHLPPIDSSKGGDSRLRLLRIPTSLFSQHCLRNAFLPFPLAPCVDALSAGCVLHVKQGADAVRKKGTRRDKRDEDTRRPHCHATRLASPRFAAVPPSSPSPSHDTSHYFTPSQTPPWVRRATPPSALPIIPLPSSQHTQFCVSWETSSGWCIEAGWFHADTHIHTPQHFRE